MKPIEIEKGKLTIQVDDLFDRDWWAIWDNMPMMVRVWGITYTPDQDILLRVAEANREQYPRQLEIPVDKLFPNPDSVVKELANKAKKAVKMAEKSSASKMKVNRPSMN